MTEETAAPNASGAPEQQFAIQKIYLRDVSFESPNVPRVFGEKWEPNVSFEMNTRTQRLSDDLFEVVLKITVTVTLGETTAFLAEVQQAGLFVLQGFKDEELGPMLGAYCPNILFPFAREAVSDLVGKGGFPQLLLAPVNFEALYWQKLQSQAQAQQSTTH